MAARRTAKSNPTPPSSPSPLEAKKRQLAEQEAALKAAEARYTKLIADAPRIAEARKKKQQDEYVRRVSRAPEARGASRLHDPRFPYELNVSTAVQRKTLRKDRHRGMVTFFALCFVLALVLWWVYHTVIRPA